MNQIIFIDFIKSLITETISAISETQYQQENKIIELKEDLLASDKELVNKYNLLEEAKKDLEELDTKEKIEDLIKIKIDSLRKVLTTYFENGYVKTIIDEGKISAKFIYNINSNAIEENTESNSKKLIIKPDKSIDEKKQKTLNLSELQSMQKLKFSPSKVFKHSNEKINAISKSMTIQTIDPIKDKDLIKTSQNLVSSVELKFRTVIIN